MSRYVFQTNTMIPIDAFTTFGLNAKPNAMGHPIGFFGTGLKYAVSIILRYGGKFRLFVNGTEFEFYTSAKDFRGKEFQQVRMKKRRGVLAKWRSEALPFTTELGKNWTLWQAFRELESNTRDEQGTSFELHGTESIDALVSRADGTTIVVDCPQFVESIGTDEVFLEPGFAKLVHSDLHYDIYDRPSRHLYFRGIRVYTFRHPARLTYDAKPGVIELSEDRTAKNIWIAQWHLQRSLMSIPDTEVLERLFTKSEDGSLTYEGEDLTFDEAIDSGAFRHVAKVLSETGTGMRSIGRYYAALPDYPDCEDTTEIRLRDTEWELILMALRDEDRDHHKCGELADRIQTEAF